MTNEEQALLNNAAIFLNKQQLVAKIEKLLAITGTRLAATLHSNNAQVEQLLKTRNYKISRGENYKAMPWQVLDFPKIGNKENLFVTRTLCWWGHHFSFNLLVTGDVWKQLRPDFVQKIAAVSANNIYISTGNDPWEQDLSNPVFRSVETCTAADIPEGFLRLGKRMELNNWEQLPLLAVETYTQMLRLLEHHA